jgi:hypothetical protein
MRVLMVIQRGTLLRFALLVPALAERGHDLHIALAGGEPPLQTIELAEKIRERHPNVTYGPFPKRTASAWGEVAWMVRGLADLAHNAHPRYAPARGLRQRTKKHVLRRLERDGSLEPLARRLAAREGRALAKKTDLERSRRALQLTAQLEGAIPTDPAIDRFVRELAPDAVVATGTFRHVSEEVEALKSARRPRHPDRHLHLELGQPDEQGRVEVHARVRLRLERGPGARRGGAAPDPEGTDPPDRRASLRRLVRAPATRTREQLLTEIGLDPAQPYLAYLCSSGTIVGAPGVRRTTSTASGEAQFICNWVGALRASGDERLRRIGMIVRPHPNSKLDADAIRFENVVVWPPGGAYPVAANARADFFDTLTHTEAVVGINTTSMIEAAIVGKSVLTVLVPEFAQETTLHFHNLLAENGGFLHVASSLDEHVPQLANVLDEDEKGQERRRRFVEWFVRPGGIDRPAAPIAAEAIEELAGLPVDRDNAARARLLRLGLSLEVGLAAAHRSYRRVRPRGD